MKQRLSQVGCLLALAALASCNGSAQRDGSAAAPSANLDTPSPTVRTPEPLGKHWVQSRQLSDLMNDISAKTQTYWAEDFPRPRSDKPSEELQRSIDAAVRLSEGLAASAERIPAMVESVKMSDADRAGFRAEAATLRSQAIQLGREARTWRTDRMQASLTAISATCISCHSRYRDFAGDLDMRRASAAERDDLRATFR